MSEHTVHTNVEDYLRWRGDLTFAQDPFNEVDNLLLCVISYIDFRRLTQLGSRRVGDAMPLGEVCALLTEEDEQRGLSDKAYIPVMRLAAQSRRFADVRLFGVESCHDEEQETQFDAVSFLVPDESLFVAYMGTDLSLAGWKENFNLCFLDTVPAQARAAEYAQAMAAACPDRPLRLGGHSKGGNLAVWAAVHLPEELQERLLAAYNNDGPGFCHDLVDTGEYGRVADRIVTLIPESSIIGVLLEHAENYEVIASSNRSVMQHEPLSWSVEGKQFVRLNQRSQMGQISDDVLRDWIGSLSVEEREKFGEVLFDLISQGGKVRTLEELRGGLSGGAALLLEYAGADEEKKTVINEVIRRLALDVGEEIKRSAGESLEAAREGLRHWIKNRGEE